MILGMYAIKDDLSGFGAPTVDQNDAVAMRNFANALNMPNTVMGFKKGDFSLYKVGEFDTELGEIESFSPILIVKGSSIPEV